MPCTRSSYHRPQKHPPGIQSRLEAGGLEELQKRMLHAMLGSEWKQVYRPLTKIVTCAEPRTHNSKMNTTLCVILPQCSRTDNLSTLCPSICFQSFRPQARLYAVHLPSLARRTMPILLAHNLITSKRSNYKLGCVCSTADSEQAPSVILWLICRPRDYLTDHRNSCCVHRYLDLGHKRLECSML